MSTQRNREEAVNTQLAILISKLGVTADAETIHDHGKHRPDVLFQMFGLRVVIEGKFNDNSNAEKIVLGDSRKRVESGIAHISCAVIYPDKIRSSPTTKLLGELNKAKLRFKIVTETHETEWFDGSPADVMTALRRAQETLTKDDIVEQTAKALSMQLEMVSRLWIGQPGACDRLSAILGMAAPSGEKADKRNSRLDTAARVSALVLANAFIFQEQLSKSDARVDTLRTIEAADDIVGETAKRWKWIWENINYVPIFQLGERVLNELPSGSSSTTAVKALLKEALAICRQQAALRHDLMGRIYHWLLHEAKYLGTYYTSVSAATLLLKLTMSLEWKVDFSSPRALADFKVADLACGTGTLLMASAQSLTDRYIQERSEKELTLEEKDISVLHQTLMQNILHGYDVLPTALHLTASTLALLAPDVAFRHMNLFVMPMGLDHGHARLGSLDFLSGSEIRTQFSLDNTHLDTVQTGAARSSYANAKIPQLNLCVMNPPFVRSVGGNLLFGSLPDDRGYLQKELKTRMRGISANVTAGLGSVFVALADMNLTVGGRLAFVLPAALVSGEAWAPTRRLIADRYHLEMVIISHDAERPNFSENTDLSEVLFVAKKRDKEPTGNTRYVGLWRNPRSIHEALDTAMRIVQVASPADISGEGFTGFSSSKAKLGEVFAMPSPRGEENWTGSLFAQTELARACIRLQEAELHIPGIKGSIAIPMCRLDAIGELGYDRRDIHDAFEISNEDWSQYPAFWGHEAAKVTSLAQKPSGKLIPRTTAAPGRKLKDADAVWSKAGPILLVERLRSNTHRVLAIGFDNPVLGNTWWSLKDAGLSIKQRKALLLWLNSSLALLLFYGRRVVTEGAWMQMKKPAWSSMPVLNVLKISEAQLEVLAKAYDKISEKELAPAAHLDTDPIRREIDEVIGSQLGFPSLQSVRELLSREPGFSAKGIGASS